jgi:hypothetical protein
MMGVVLSLEEVVTERKPPFQKAWETVDAKLLVIGPYRLGFELTPHGTTSKLRVFIDYDLSEKHRWLGRLFGKMYARWCTERMATDAAKHFEAADPHSYKPSHS